MATEAELRAGLEVLMTATVADEAAKQDWTYRAVRPMYVPPGWRVGQEVAGDCSKGCQYLCRWDGLPDPMHQEYGPFGNSTTLWQELVHIELSQVKVGDFVVFGINGSEHATMVKRIIRKNRKIVDLELWSFGHEGAPNVYLLSRDTRVYQCLRLRVTATHAMVAVDVLLAETGYGAWRQWRLGTGAWRGYGKRNRDVRPNVPRHIPLSWWRMLAASLKYRRKASANPVTPATLAASAG